MNLKHFALAALLLAAKPSQAALGNRNQSASDRLMKSQSGTPRYYDRETLKRELSDTMELIEALALQAEHATQPEMDEAWASGERDFKLTSGEVGDTRKACGELLKARLADTAGDPKKAASLRADARQRMNPHHKKKSEDYVRDLRNWITVNEGVLRRANEAREKK